MTNDPAERDRAYLAILDQLLACDTIEEVADVMDQHRAAWVGDPLWADLAETASQLRILMRRRDP